MTKFFPRWIILSCLVLITGEVLLLFTSPSLHRPVGVIAFDIVGADGIHRNYVDYDMRMQHTSSAATDRVGGFAVPTYDAASEQVTVSLFDGTSEQQIGSYDIVSPFVRVVWQDFQTSLLIIYAAPDTTQTIIEQINVDTGTKQPFAVIDDFLVGDLRQSPHGPHILLRAFQEGSFRSVNSPRAMMLLDSESGAVTDMGSPAYAYWSPDGRKIAIGHLTENTYEVDAAVYDVVSNTTQLLDVKASQLDTPYFVDSADDTGIQAILWSPDSGSLVVYNRTQEAMYHVYLDGSVFTYAGGFILPRAWSPNGRYLLGMGNHASVAGAFVYDTVTEQRHHLKSDTTIQNNLVDVAWSNDSQHIALLPRTPGVNQKFRLLIFDVEGRMLEEQPIRQPSQQGFIMDRSLRWIG